MLALAPRAVIREALNRAARGDLPVPDWRSQDCARAFTVPAEAAKALRKAYGGVAKGLAAVAAAVAAEVRGLMRGLEVMSDGSGCVCLRDVARALVERFGYSSDAARHIAARILRHLGYVRRAAAGHKAYYCRGEAKFVVGGAQVTPEAVADALRRLACGCRSRVCRVKLRALLSELGLPASGSTLHALGEILAGLGLTLQRMGRYGRIYVVVTREALGRICEGSS
jgi:hypothetical protein